MISPEALFTRVFDDLEAKSKSNDWYEFLQCARLLRQLLVDGERLLDAANRNLCLKITYDVNEWEFRDGAPYLLCIG